MNKFWKTKWLEALRSNEYKQARGSLKQEGKYCCLGVLCDIYGKKNNGKWQQQSFPAFILNGRMSNGHIDFRLANRIGLNGTIQSKLASMNDSGQDFEKIADYIEQNL